MLEANLLSQINSSIRARDPDMVEIIDVHWIANDLLLIVSNQGVEFVQVRQKSSAGGSGGIIGSPHCKTVKVVPLTVRWYRYLVLNFSYRRIVYYQTSIR
jgi:hypothetical protein